MVALTLKLSRKQVFAFLFILTLVGSGGYFIGVQAVTSNPTWTLNYPLNPAADYTIGIYANGTAYWVSADGQSYYSSTNTTDVSDVFNSVINGTGRTVFVNSGTYIVGHSITASNVNQVTLTLARGAKITSVTNFNNAIIFLQKSTNWIIQGGEIDGNNANNQADPGSNYRSGNGIHLENCTGITIQNMYIHNARCWGIVALYKSSGISIINNYISHCNWNGITLGDDWTGFTTENCIVSGNHITYCGDLGISFYGNYLTATNNVITNMTYTHTYGGSDGSHWGIATEGDAQWCIIQNNIITGCEQGVALTTSGTKPVYSVVQNNMMNNITYSGVSIQSGNYSTIENNIFRTCFFGVDVASACTNNVAIGNDYRGVTNTIFNNAGGVTNTNNCYIDGSGYHA